MDLLNPEKAVKFIFNKNSVAGQWLDSLSVGDKIRYVEEKDDLGPQASIVYP